MKLIESLTTTAKSFTAKHAKILKAFLCERSGLRASKEGIIHA
jgi:hypothetical protein